MIGNRYRGIDPAVLVQQYTRSLEDMTGCYEIGDYEAAAVSAYEVRLVLEALEAAKPKAEAPV